MKRLTVVEFGCIKCLADEGYSNREIARSINNFVQDTENYGRNYRDSIQTDTYSEGNILLLLFLLLILCHPQRRISHT